MPAAEDGSSPAGTSSPAPASVRLPAPIVDAIIAHARAEAPQEACGLIIGSAEPADRGEPLRYAPCRNEAASPVRFRIHPDDVVHLLVAADVAGEALWAIVHSHPGSQAVPSATDIDAAAWWPSTLHVLVSLASGPADGAAASRSLRAWWIVDAMPVEVAVEPA